MEEKPEVLMNSARNRETILSKLHQEGEVGDLPEPTPSTLHERPHLLPRILASRLAENGAECHLTTEHAHSVDLLADLIFQSGVRTVALSGEDLLLDLNLFEVLSERLPKVAFFRAGETSREEWMVMELGVTTCEALIAESGTIILSPVAKADKACSILPVHHVVLGAGERLFPDLPSWMSVLPPEERTRSRIYMHGPSRTADIEKKIVLGIHGPKRVTVFAAVGQVLDHQS
jgi:L-lactate utilization protein LutC